MADEVKKVDVVSAGTSSSVQSAVANATIDDQFSDIRGELMSRFELLPDDIKKAITDDAYQTKLFTIAKEKKMTYEELGTMETETTMVLLGMTKPEDFRDELQLELKKNDAEIDALVKNINEQVFAPIRASLERVYAAKKEPIDYLTESGVKTSETASVAASTPVPPPPAPTLSTQDKTVLAKTGVVISETPTLVAPIQASQIPNRNDLMKGIENPQKSVPIGIVANKLGAQGPAMPTKTTDYSVLKGTATPPATGTATPPPARTGPDPYREIIN